MRLSRVVPLLALGGTALAATAAEWRSRAIYQVLTDRFARTDGSTTATCDTQDRVYCGGSYQGLINHLDYIQDMGFTAIWISPVTYQLQGMTGDGSSYHGYWQQDLYRLNSNFGTVADLKALSAALHARGMYLMVDIVVNHNGWDGAVSTVDYSQFNPFNSVSDYHSYCVPDYNNETSVEDCWLGDNIVPLVDLKTEASNVASGYQTWIRELVSNYSIDGLRIDTARQVNPGFWSGFQEAAGVFMTGEIYDGDSSFACPFQDYIGSILNYPIYFPAVAAFESTSGSISGLVDMITAVQSSCEDFSVLPTFTENHDQPRFASITEDMSLAQNVISYTIMGDGIPIIYEGQEQHYNALGGSNDPYNREAIWYSGYNTEATLYELVAALNQVRNQAIYMDSGYTTYKSSVIYSDSSTIALRKGTTGKQVVSVLSNLGAGGTSYTLTLENTGYTANAKLVEILSCTSVTADSSGNIAVPMASGLPRIYYPQTAIQGSGICGTLSGRSLTADSGNCTY